MNGKNVIGIAEDTGGGTMQAESGGRFCSQIPRQPTDGLGCEHGQLVRTPLRYVAPLTYHFAEFH